MWLIAAGIVLAAFTLYTRSNTFPYYYHIDEPLEIRLLLQNDTNFNHPLLMRNVANAAAWLTGLPRTPQNLVVIGRSCNAAFGAIAAAAFAWLAFHYGGTLAGAASGLLVALHPLLFELTHYYKEDPALLMGMALTFLAFAHYWDNPCGKTALLSGAAGALAISGKYVGVVAVILALGVILARPRQTSATRGRHVALFLAALTAVVLTINIQWISSGNGVTSGVGREVALLGSHGGQTGGFQWTPDDKYLGAFFENSNVLIGFFIAWQLVRMVVMRRSFPEWLIVGFAIAFAIVLTFLPKTAGRYFLPVSATGCFLAGLGLASFGASAAGWLHWKQRGATALTLGLIAVACSTYLPTILKLERGLATDSRRELAGWITDNVSPTAIVAQDARVQLAGSKPKDIDDRAFTLPQTVLTGDFVADLGTVADLQQRGVTYVAIEPNGHGKGGRSPGGSTKAERKAFDNDLKDHAELVWTCKSRSPKILHPNLKLYRLKPLGSATAEP